MTYRNCTTSSSWTVSVYAYTMEECITRLLLVTQRHDKANTVKIPRVRVLHRNVVRMSLSFFNNPSSHYADYVEYQSRFQRLESRQTLVVYRETVVSLNTLRSSYNCNLSKLSSSYIDHDAAKLLSRNDIRNDTEIFC